jgi:hypothetical protein
VANLRTHCRHPTFITPTADGVGTDPEEFGQLAGTILNHRRDATANLADTDQIDRWYWYLLVIAL